MNYDRFLTRVFDKEEKRMIYSGDDFKYNNALHCFLGINGLHQKIETVSGGQYDCVLLGDRLVPMMCEGSQDRHRKILYEEDIFVRCDLDGDQHMFLCRYKDSMLTAFSIEKGAIIHACSAYGVGIGKSEIIGNKWENENLLEGKE